MDLSGLSMYRACLLHSRAERVLKTLVSKHLDEWGITRMEWLLLATVAEPAKHDEGHTMGEVARELDIRLSQLTALATNMNREGLLSQLISSKDRRTKYVRITPRGMKFLSDIEKSMRSAMRTWLAEIPRDKLADYMATVEELGSEKRLA